MVIIGEMISISFLWWRILTNLSLKHYYRYGVVSVDHCPPVCWNRAGRGNKNQAVSTLDQIYLWSVAIKAAMHNIQEAQVVRGALSFIFSSNVIM